jgi:ATP-dependent helicase/nuclease subunit B
MGATVREPIAVEIMTALEQGAVVLTASPRAAQSMRRGFDQQRRDQGLTSWQPPMILSWDAWITTLWRQQVIAGYAEKLLLNRTQEHAVWHGILEADEDLASLRTRDSLAEMAADAWARLCRYNGRDRVRETAGFSTDTRSFQRWARAFERRCHENGLLAQAQLEEVLQQAISSGKIELPEGGVALVGFDDMTPSQHELVDAVRMRGTMVREISQIGVAGRRILFEAADEREELEAAARWVRRILEEQPEARAALIVPSLESERSEIDRMFRETLATELEDIRAEGAGPYEFSLGVKLPDVPMLVTAFDLLRWVGGALPLERVSALLVSRDFAGERERTARAEFDAFEMRRTRMLRPELSLEKMIALVEKSPRRERLLDLHEALRGILRIVQRRFGGQARLRAEWTDAIRELLGVAKWTSNNSENNMELQILERWESTLDELATLDFDGMRVEFADALKDLERIARETAFLPEPREAPVQVMSPQEAVGESFDAIWFLGTSDLQWPIPASASPLLPWVAQKELGMPGTDAGRDGEQARRMTEQIAGIAPVVVFSYAKESAEGKQRASSALAGITLERVAMEDLIAAKGERTMLPLEEVVDAEQIAPPPDTILRGGAKVLQLQAACGFRAFAEQRLASAELDDIELGMDAAERGNVVHKTLEIFWNEVKSQTTLNSMTDAEREEGLSWAIEQALKRTAELAETPWDAEFVDMQCERLQILLRPWLDLESARTPFIVKLNEEQFEDVKVGPLRLSVRVDRIDAGEDGEIIIDYKTGAAAPKDWLTERPDAPQLPLYAILSQAPVLEAVAFGQVRAGKDMGLHGFATSSGALMKTAKLPQGVATLEEQVEEWRHVLTTLAEDFYRGDTRVRPKKYPETCKHCGQRLICRIDVTEREDDSDEADGEVMGG